MGGLRAVRRIPELWADGRLYREASGAACPVCGADLEGRVAPGSSGPCPGCGLEVEVPGWMGPPGELEDGREVGWWGCPCGCRWSMANRREIPARCPRCGERIPRRGGEG